DGFMGGDGLLSLGEGSAQKPVGLNALWFSVMSLLAEELTRVKDPMDDHFDRLAGRFRRSFTKLFWCDAHRCLCEPRVQMGVDHLRWHADPDQLLAVVLPFSA